MMQVKYVTGAFLVVALTFASRGQTQTESLNIGTCSDSDIKREKMQCRVNFFVELKNDPFGDCGEKYEALRNCSKQMIVNCLKGTMDSELLAMMVNVFISLIVKAMGAKDIYCQHGEITLSLISSKASTEACRDRLVEDFMPCSTEYHRIFSENPADLRLCRKYNETMECAISKINDSICTAEEAAAISEGLDDNPVCEADRILGIAPPTVAPIKHGTISTLDTKVQQQTLETNPTEEGDFKTSRRKEPPKETPAVKELKDNSAFTYRPSTILYLTVLCALFNSKMLF